MFVDVTIGFIETESVVREDIGTVQLNVGVLSGVLSPEVSIAAVRVVFGGGSATGTQRMSVHAILSHPLPHSLL